jgi:hypothetical protein
MDYSALNTLIDSAFNTAIENGNRVFPYEIALNTILQVDTYNSPNGNGFRVVCSIFDKINNTITTRIRNYGPDTKSEQNWTTYKYPPF